MNNLDVFMSVGLKLTPEQNVFVSAIEERLRSENLIPRTLGRNEFSPDAPLRAITELMNDCSGTIIVALERTYFPSGIDRRGGSEEQPLSEIKYATPWNQIEAAMAHSKLKPLMVIVEEGVRAEGLLKEGYDWYVMTIKPEIATLGTPAFAGVLSKWKKKVEAYNAQKPNKETGESGDKSIGELIKSLTPASLWGTLVALGGLISGSFAAGMYYYKVLNFLSD